VTPSRSQPPMSALRYRPEIPAHTRCSGGISERELYDADAADPACTAGRGRRPRPSCRGVRARRDPAAEGVSLAAYVLGRLPIPIDVESLGEDRCAFEPGSDHPEMLALYLGMLDADFEIVDSPALVDALRKLAGRYRRAIDASQQAAG
jgi:hypothetical protein